MERSRQASSDSDCATRRGTTYYQPVSAGYPHVAAIDLMDRLSLRDCGRAASPRAVLYRACCAVPWRAVPCHAVPCRAVWCSAVLRCCDASSLCTSSISALQSSSAENATACRPQHSSSSARLVKGVLLPQPLPHHSRSMHRPCIRKQLASLSTYPFAPSLHSHLHSTQTPHKQPYAAHYLALTHWCRHACPLRFTATSAFLCHCTASDCSPHSSSLSPLSPPPPPPVASSPFPSSRRPAASDGRLV